MLFRRLSLRHLRAHKLRTLFTVSGIALGVATVTGMRLVHESVSSGYERTVERIAGKAAFQITNGEVGVPEELLEEVRSVEGVAAAVASVQGFVSAPGLRGERLYVFGIDLLADQTLRQYEFGTSSAEVEDPLVFLAQPDSVALTEGFLRRNALSVDDPVEIVAPSGRTVLTARGVLDVRRGPASLFAGRLAVMDVFAAQRLFALDRRFSQIDVGLAEGADAEAVRGRLARAVGARGVVERPESRGEMLDRLLTANRYGMTVAAMLTVVVGLYRSPPARGRSRRSPPRFPAGSRARSPRFPESSGSTWYGWCGSPTTSR